jgi:hypothetical protein
MFLTHEENCMLPELYQGETLLAWFFRISSLQKIMSALVTTWHPIDGYHHVLVLEWGSSLGMEKQGAIDQITP